MPSAPTVSQLDLGHYEAERAAALAGVSRSTLYYWARTDLIVPSISPHREKLWSYRGLLTLRLVRWLRLPKDDLGVTATTMSDVRRLMDTVGQRLWSIDASGREVPTILVGRDGTVLLVSQPQTTVDHRRPQQQTTSSRTAPAAHGRPTARRSRAATGTVGSRDEPRQVARDLRPTGTSGTVNDRSLFQGPGERFGPGATALDGPGPRRRAPPHHQPRAATPTTVGQQGRRDASAAM